MPWTLCTSVTVVPFTTTKPHVDVKWPASICFNAKRRLTCLFMAILVLPLSLSHVQADSPSLDHLITKVAIQESLDPALLRAVVATESDFNSDLVSPGGAVGLMQLMPETARTLGVKDIYDPEQNLRGGARYLGLMLKKFPQIPHALAAYNAGPKLVARFQGVPPIRHTKRYVDRVLDYYQQHVKLDQKQQYKIIAHIKNIDDKPIHTASSGKVAKPDRPQWPTRIAPPLPVFAKNIINPLKSPKISAGASKSVSAAELAMAGNELVDGELIPIMRVAH